MTEFPDRIPVSTYRIQLSPSFPLSAAAQVCSYISRLGVTDVYCSPVLTASPGSSHGYDTCDHLQVNPELGGEEALNQLTVELRKRDLGLILDFVPNHMGAHPMANRWWRDVLENGPSSPYARYFDIDWNPVKDELQGKLLLPILGDQYGVALDEGKLQLEHLDGMFRLRYYDHLLPLNPRQLRILLRHNVHQLQARLPASDPDVAEFLSILFHLDHIPAYTESSAASIEERRREKDVAQHRLAVLMRQCEEVRRHVESNVELFNGVPGDAASFDLLHTLLEAQPYRLSFWRTAMHEINYRRFFDINELVGIRMEDPAVFQDAHRLIFQLIREGVVTGVRLDHVDGLFDPAGYFDELNRRVRPAKIYVAVEKILTEGERLREDWAVHGTTGYEFLNLVNGIFVDRMNSNEFRKLYARFTGAKRSFPEVAYAAKKLIVSTSMASELNVLAYELNRISESDRQFRDFTLHSLREALTEVTACFPVYRTYFRDGRFDAFDRSNVERAIEEALRRNPALEPSIFEFLREMLLTRENSSLSREEYNRRVHFAMKFQQYTGPVQAKGLEDTAFYRYGPLLSLNEVGGHPSRFGITVEEFHRANLERLRSHPLSMICTGTHDTKRGEDARARINVLSEIPREWRDAVMRWARINAPARSRVNGEFAPDRSDEYLYYQALLGAWPAGCTSATPEFAGRMMQYMNKAAKEKKVHTSWVHPHAAYDEAVLRFVEQTLLGTRAAPFLTQFLPFQEMVAQRGVVRSLAQVVLKLTSPGVPDFYQGAEAWDLSLVDPDNRRPIDFKALEKQLESLEPMLSGVATAAGMADALRNWQDGRIKQYITVAGLRLRRNYRALFLRGDYVPLGLEGAVGDHVVAFERRLEERSVVVACPCRQMGEVEMTETKLKVTRGWYQHVFTGEQLESRDCGIPLEALFRACPVAILTPIPERW